MKFECCTESDIGVCTAGWGRGGLETSGKRVREKDVTNTGV